ncbi:MAG: hypothetical protein M1823_002354 [Watsoniomyces obsoletus]|nr:MAG: hypothetical protein M1823_002354 [Watsoniomyces obsoletus]
MTDSTIYTGPWIDWARGPARGMTITLRAEHGQLLTAFLGIFVTVVGAQSWTIVSFIIHQIRAKRALGDAQHQQVQATLRNQGTALGAAWQLAQLWIPWRASSSLSRSLLAIGPLTVLAVLHAVLWGLAGTFSSYAGKGAGQDFLIRGPTCGFWLPDSLEIADQWLVQSKNLNDSITAADYVQLCYDNPRNTPACNRFVRPSISWKKDVNATCPFDPALCLLGNRTSMSMDTGYLDSLTDFGINLRPSDRVIYRRVTTCAPIRLGRHVALENVTFPGWPQPKTFLRFYLGGMRGYYNYTYQYNMDAVLAGGSYDLVAKAQTAAQSSSVWEPAPAVNRTDADVSFFFQSPNSVYYTAPVDDPFFAAHDRRTTPSGIVTYHSDFAVRVMGCVDQHQLCNPSGGGNGNGGYKQCTPLLGGQQIDVDSDALGFSMAQGSVAYRFLMDLFRTQIGQSVIGRGASALLASRTVHERQQAPLPNNQWQLEVATWFNVGLATLQAQVVEFAAGPTVVGNRGQVRLGKSPTNRAMCTRQKVRNPTGYTNFSALGVIIILVLGSGIIVLSWVLETLVGLIQRYLWKQTDYKRLQWLLNSTLQLQRMAFETAGLGGPWVRCDEPVPVTSEKRDLGEIYQVIDTSAGHPTLVRRRASESETSRSDGKTQVTVVENESSAFLTPPAGP